jgi:hypothetical protein
VSDKQDIQEALKAAGAPDYMVLIITKIMGAEDAAREMMAKLSAEYVEVRQREQAVLNSERLLAERQQAFMDAAEDMKNFVNRIYGPDSELTRISQKLGGIEAAGAARDKRYMDRFQAIDENQTRLKDSIDVRFHAVHQEIGLLAHRVSTLEQKAG